jgi:hypothetical protein
VDGQTESAGARQRGRDGHDRRRPLLRPEAHPPSTSGTPGCSGATLRGTPPMPSIRT